MTGNLRPQQVHVWHLEMKQPPTERPVTQKLYELKQAKKPLPELNRFLYAAVGAPWMWHLRLNWSWQQWSNLLHRMDIETWVAYQDATPVGYFELEKQAGNQAEIAYFGLIPEFIGQGLGKALLEDAIDKAWQLAERRIWLHTCTLDHPAALPNYLARGFSIFKEEDFEEMLPAMPLEAWPGAKKSANKSVIKGTNNEIENPAFR